MSSRALRMAPPVPSVAAALLAALAACGDPAGPNDGALTLTIRSGDAQFGAPGATLLDPFEVVVVNRRQEAVPGATVTWRVLDGTGGSMTPASAVTDSSGVATSRLRLGSQPEPFRVEAAVSRGAEPVFFTAQAVLAPVVDGVDPMVVGAGETVRILGRNFSAEPAHNTVLFGGMRGTVLSASDTELVVEVPRCVPERSVAVTVQLGPVTSEGTQIEVTGAGGTVLDLEIGQSVTLSAAPNFGCVRLPGGQANAAYLVVTQNVAGEPDQSMPFQLAGLVGRTTSPPLVRLAATVAGADIDTLGVGPVAADWELRLRAMERTIDPRSAVRREGDVGILGTVRPPVVGERRDFRVLNKDGKLATVTAEVKHVSGRAILYQDLDAPAGGFTAQDFAVFGQYFDDPIYDAVVSVFGAPSDVDENGMVIVLFTPVVNAMTPRGSSGFIAGFFYGLDLTTQTGSNRAEIFYSMVPDPNGQFSDSRRTDQVLNVVPPVLAHEFQHMIHFNQRVLLRSVGTESLWLSEGLAHMAEEVVALMYRARNDNTNADRFQISNYVRASRYLDQAKTSSVIGTRPPGTLEERGAQWLMVKYLTGHHGGHDFLRRVTQTTRLGVGNVTAETGRPWGALLGDWSIALWASGAPELQGVTMEPRLRFSDFNLRQELSRFQLPALRPAQVSFDDFLVRETLSSSTAAHLLVEAPAGHPQPLHLSLGARWGGDFAAHDRPQLTVTRVR